MEESYKTIKNKEEHILVKGDISGIQEFIFNVKSDGAAKSLKAKSFFIKSLSKISVAYLFDKFDIQLMDRENFTISVSGGNFFILLPQVENSEHILKEYSTKTNLLLSRIGLSIVLTHTIYNENTYSNNLEELNKQAQSIKYKLLNDLPYDKLFVPFQGSDSMNWINFGKSLGTSKSFSINKYKEDSLNLTKRTISFLSYQLELSNDGVTDIQLSLENKLDTCFPLNVEKKEVMKFEDIAGKAGSTTKLGILKIDVDNLGGIFQKIDNAINHKKLSEDFRTFFENRLFDIIYNNAYYKNSIYSILSGGDDCFLVGDWYKIIELAFDINSKFKSFWKNNKLLKDTKVTISAGITIVHSKFPVIRFAEMVENALHQAKTTKHWDQVKFETNTYSCKDCISLFNTTIKWDDWPRVSEIRSNLESFIAFNPRSLLMNARKAVLNNRDLDKIKLSDFWKLAYHLREVNKSGNVQILNDILTLYENNLLESIEKNDNRYYHFFPIASRLVELKTRN